MSDEYTFDAGSPVGDTTDPYPSVSEPATSTEPEAPTETSAKPKRAKRGPGRRAKKTASPRQAAAPGKAELRRAVAVTLAVVNADTDTVDALARLTDAEDSDLETVAEAVACGLADSVDVLRDVLNLADASTTQAGAMRVAVKVATAEATVQKSLWATLTRLDLAEGRASSNPTELSLAIVEAGQAIPEDSRAALDAALDILDLAHGS